MKYFLAIMFLLIVLSVFTSSVWYVVFRLRTLLGLRRRRPLRITVAGGLIVSLVAMLAGPRFASAAVGILGMLGGYIVSLFIFLTLWLLLLHVIQLGLKLHGKWIVASASVLAHTHHRPRRAQGHPCRTHRCHSSRLRTKWRAHLSGSCLLPAPIRDQAP